MSKATKYGLPDLIKDFPDDRACLEYLFDTLHDRTCSCGGTYSLLSTRKQFQCSQCRKQIAPTAGTIFHKSSTPLTLWFHAIFVFSNAKSGVSAAELERQLSVTYKTAWRMLHMIRKSLLQDTKKLKGTVEMDGAYFGGRNSQKEKFSEKSLVLAAVERKGNLKAKIVKDGSSQSHRTFILDSVRKSTTLMTDTASSYLFGATDGYKREAVNHSKKEYVRGKVYTNTVESFWSHVKNSLRGTHKVISKKYLQTYLDGFVFHYNFRSNDRTRFSVLLDTLLHA